MLANVVRSYLDRFAEPADSDRWRTAPVNSWDRYGLRLSRSQNNRKAQDEIAAISPGLSRTIFRQTNERNYFAISSVHPISERTDTRRKVGDRSLPSLDGAFLRRRFRGSRAGQRDCEPCGAGELPQNLGQPRLVFA